MSDRTSMIIQLTQDQRNAIREATGHDVSELTVKARRVQVAPGVLEARKGPYTVGDRLDDRKAPFAGGEQLSDRKAPIKID